MSVWLKGSSKSSKLVRIDSLGLYPFSSVKQLEVDKIVYPDVMEPEHLCTQEVSFLYPILTNHGL